MASLSPIYRYAFRALHSPTARWQRYNVGSFLFVLVMLGREKNGKQVCCQKCWTAENFIKLFCFCSFWKYNRFDKLIVFCCRLVYNTNTVFLNRRTGRTTRLVILTRYIAYKVTSERENSINFTDTLHQQTSAVFFIIPMSALYTSLVSVELTVIYAWMPNSLECYSHWITHATNKSVYISKANII